MTQNMKLDDLDKAALATLAEFEISNDGTVATVASAEIEVVRPTDNQFKMTIRFPSDEEFIVIKNPGRFWYQSGRILRRGRALRSSIHLETSRKGAVMTHENVVSAADDKRHRKMLARRLRANGFVRHAGGFWLASTAAPEVPSDENDEANERKPA